MDLATLLAQLERTQWEKRERFYPKCPILTRFDLQRFKAPLGNFTTKTSGSTGIPVTVQRTYLSNLWWNATNLLEVIWHKRDLSQSFAIIRPTIKEEMRQKDWGPAFALLGKTGPLYGHPIHGDLNDWLRRIEPGYLWAYPSIIDSLDPMLLAKLKGIKTTGERITCRHPLIADMYSAEEVGTIAIQCPDNSEVYHVMENILVEILDEENRPATSGKVVLTDLTSHYLYRYEIGDYAEFGECHCGRGLQTIKKILGRRRNMLRLPDGKEQWATIGSLEYRKIAPIKRFQLAQVAATVMELRIIVDDPLTEEQQDALRALIQKATGYPFEVHIVYVDRFPLGKFEEFVNLMGSTT